jgi:tetratricopeptide (TPR) repeat protein
MQGRKADAIRAAEAIRESVSPLIDAMPMMVDVFVPTPVFALVRFQQWDQIMALCPPDPELLASTALWRFGRAIALAGKGQRQKALEEKQAFEAARQKVPADWLWINNKAGNVLGVASAILDARLAESDQAATPHWEQAVSLQDALSYDEPPPWFYPVRESLGGALLRAGQADRAEEVFREGLRRSPRNGRLLFGLMESLKAQNKTYAAELVRREFESAWKSADVTLRLADL